MEAQASIPVEIIKTLSRDLMEYAQHMVKEHGEDYKVKHALPRLAVVTGYYLTYLIPIYYQALGKNKGKCF